MTERIKENALICFTLSLVVSYFWSTGYYLHFQLDISSFLSIEDLIIIYSKGVWMSGILVILLIFLFHSVFKSMEEESGWMNRTIGRTTIKRRAFVLLFLVCIVIGSAFFSEIVASIISTLLGLSLLVTFIVGLIFVAFSSINGKKEINEINFSDWAYFLCSLYICIILIPAVGGATFASKLTFD